jgi:hypothetical protein
MISIELNENSVQLELMFGLVELQYRLREGGSANPTFFFICYKVESKLSNWLELNPNKSGIGTKALNKEHIIRCM